MISLVLIFGFLYRSSIFRYPDDLRNIVQQCARSAPDGSDNHHGGYGRHQYGRIIKGGTDFQSTMRSVLCDSLLSIRSNAHGTIKSTIDTQSTIHQHQHHLHYHHHQAQAGLRPAVPRLGRRMVTSPGKQTPHIPLFRISRARTGWDCWVVTSPGE